MRNFAIVPELSLDIREGFTAITGETGAGKSILVDALGLLLGERSDASWVSSGAERAELTAEFLIADNHAAQDWLEEYELAADGCCLLRRTINANGRSRAFINGSPVTVTQIQSLGQLLVEIHGQNEHLRLTKTAEQFKLLDDGSNYPSELDRVKSSYTRWRQVAEQLQSLEQETALSATDLEFLKFQLAELQQQDLSEDAITALQTEHDRLAAGGALLDALITAMGLLQAESGIDGGGINADINTTLTLLRKFVPLDADIREACQMLQEAAVNCNEATHSLRVARDRVDLNPARFEQAANTLSQLHDLARKHRVQMEGLEEIRDTLSRRIELADSAEQRRNELESALKNHLDEYREAAKNLHLKRKRHAHKLSSSVMDLMNELGMVGGTFSLAVSLKPHARRWRGISNTDF
jgi:DNA repair protein RecN (Recombination protein N)